MNYLIYCGGDFITTPKTLSVVNPFTKKEFATTYQASEKELDHAIKKAQEVLTLLKKALRLPADYPISEEKGSASDQFGLYADISRIQKELHWSPQVPLANGIEKMVHWGQSLILK